MQTFLPVATTDYREIAKTLDNLRLNKQALEGWQILMNLLAIDPAGDYREPKGWSNHPAVKMWRGHEFALLKYILAMVDEWKARGYNSTIGDKAIASYNAATSVGLNYELAQSFEAKHPEWIAEDVASSHRQALLVKNYKWYSQFNWPEDTGVEPTEYTYIWPTEQVKEKV